MNGYTLTKDEAINKWDILLVRACKSKRASIEYLRRYKSKRCGVKMNFIEDHFILEDLLRLIQKYDLSGMQELIFMTHPDQYWRYGFEPKAETDVFILSFIAASVSVIRCSPVKKFPCFISPRRFRD